MKKNFLKVFAVSCLLLLVSQEAPAQSKKMMIRIDCFTSNRVKGDDYRTLRKFDLATQQYQAAKYCKGISRLQVHQIDSLIELTRRQQVNSQKVLIRRY